MLFPATFSFPALVLKNISSPPLSSNILQFVFKRASFSHLAIDTVNLTLFDVIVDIEVGFFEAVITGPPVDPVQMIYPSLFSNPVS